MSNSYQFLDIAGFFLEAGVQFARQLILTAVLCMHDTVSQTSWSLMQVYELTDTSSYKLHI